MVSQEIKFGNKSRKHRRMQNELNILKAIRESSLADGSLTSRFVKEFTRINKKNTPIVEPVVIGNLIDTANELGDPVETGAFLEQFNKLFTAKDFSRANSNEYQRILASYVDDSIYYIAEQALRALGRSTLDSLSVIDDFINKLKDTLRDIILDEMKRQLPAIKKQITKVIANPELAKDNLY